MGAHGLSRKAVFLDRDGTLNHLWFNPQTDEWESPIRPEDFRLIDGVAAALASLREQGFQLFVLSNQPSAAKGKCTRADLDLVDQRFVALTRAAGIEFDERYYSYSHPDAADSKLRQADGRKPDPYYINLAIERHLLDRAACWMIGDRDSDIECGQRAGVRTIQVQSPEPDGKAGQATPDFRAATLREAATLIIAGG